MSMSDTTPSTPSPAHAPSPPHGPNGTPEDPSGNEAPEVQKAIRYAAFADLYLDYRHWVNPRTTTGLGDPEIAALAESILGGTTSTGHDDESVKVYAGVRVPLEVVMIKSNGSTINLIIDGQRRYRGVEVAGLPPEALIPVVDLEPVPVDWTAELANHYLLRALHAVGTRAGLSSFELSEAAQRLRASRDPDTGKDYTLATISEAIGRSESWVSRMLAARASARPQLLQSWKLGEITDEEFKDLATAKDHATQKANTEAVVAARKEGDKTSARTTAKEQRELAKPSHQVPPSHQVHHVPKNAKPSAGKTAPPTSGKAVRGPQAEMPIPPPRKPPSYAVIEDFLGLAKKRPPTHDYVKGLMDGARWASGGMDAAGFARPWQAYMHHVQGGGPAPRAAKPKAKPARKVAKKRR